MRWRSRGTLLALGLVAIGMLASVAAARDVVEFEVKEGQKTQLLGDIVQEGWQKVRIEFERDGETKTAEIPRDRILKIQHGNKPQAYIKADRKFKNRNYAEAYEAFRKITESPPSDEKKAWVEPYARFRAGMSAYKAAVTGGTGDQRSKKFYDRAAEQFAEMRSRFPDHRFTPEASLRMVRARIESGQLSGLSGILDEIANSEYPGRVKQSARILRARLMTARDNPKEAVQELETVRDAVGDKWPALQYEAMMAEAEARAALDQPGQAESLWWKVAVRAADDRLRAKAAVNRGLSLKKRGQLREALYSFLRVAILHTDQVENYQKALYHAALTAREYYDGNQRAKELASELFSHYPESGWTKRLRNEMKGGGNGSGS